MDYHGLTKSYRQGQIERIRKALARIGDSNTSPGRVIPENEQLIIGEGRTLPMAVLFLDISGFSSWSSETPAEQRAVLNALNLFFTEMVRIAEDYGGTIEKNTGDGLMAYFADGSGDPAEGGSTRAVACALTMHDTNARILSPVLANAGFGPIQFRVAIEHGTVTVGRLGAAKRFNAAVAVGTAANIASKMLARAQSGEVLIGARVRYQLPTQWQEWWTQAINEPSGWIYRTTGVPYQFFRYTGRWTEPK